MKTFKIDGQLVTKYRGCGSAVAKIKLRFEGQRRYLDALVDFEYERDGDGERSLDMSDRAGTILGYERADNGSPLVIDPERFMEGFDAIPGGVVARVIVNLSCYEACLA